MQLQTFILHSLLGLLCFIYHPISCFFLPPSPPLSSGREDRYTHEFVSDDDEEDGVDANNDTLQQSFANFSQVGPRFAQMMEDLQSSLYDESDPNQNHHHHQHQVLKGKMVPILSGDSPKHEHRDSGISGESDKYTVTRPSGISCYLYLLRPTH